MAVASIATVATKLQNNPM